MAMAEDVERPCAHRRNAASVLARLGSEHQITAVRVLTRLASDSTNSAGERLSSAQALAELGGEHRNEAGRLLSALATNPHLQIWQRLSASEELAKLPDQHREHAAGCCSSSRQIRPKWSEHDDQQHSHWQCWAETAGCRPQTHCAD